MHKVIKNVFNQAELLHLSSGNGREEDEVKRSVSACGRNDLVRIFILLDTIVIISFESYSI